jgi:hypothetical protein
MMMSRCITRTSVAAVATRQLLRSKTARRKLANVTDAASPLIRRVVSLEERAFLRAERKARASQILKPAGKESTMASSSGMQIPANYISYAWFLGLMVPTGLFAWGYNDETSPPARFSEMVGLTAWIQSVTDPVAMPAHEKLLPDWNQVSQDIGAAQMSPLLYVVECEH